MDTSRVTIDRLTDNWNVVEFQTPRGKLSFVLPSDDSTAGIEHLPLEFLQKKSTFEVAVFIAEYFIKYAKTDPAFEDKGREVCSDLLKVTSSVH